MAKRVLITGARAPAALELARSFAAAGLEVHMADCSRARIARRSKTPKAVHAYASPRASNPSASLGISKPWCNRLIR